LFVWNLKNGTPLASFHDPAHFIKCLAAIKFNNTSRRKSDHVNQQAKDSRHTPAKTMQTTTEKPLTSTVGIQTELLETHQPATVHRAQQTDNSGIHTTTPANTHVSTTVQTEKLTTYQDTAMQTEVVTANKELQVNVVKEAHTAATQVQSATAHQGQQTNLTTYQEAAMQTKVATANKELQANIPKEAHTAATQVQPTTGNKEQQVHIRPSTAHQGQQTNLTTYQEATVQTEVVTADKKLQANVVKEAHTAATQVQPSTAHQGQQAHIQPTTVHQGQQTNLTTYQEAAIQTEVVTANKKLQVNIPKEAHTVGAQAQPTTVHQRQQTDLTTYQDTAIQTEVVTADKKLQANVVKEAHTAATQVQPTTAHQEQQTDLTTYQETTAQTEDNYLGAFNQLQQKLRDAERKLAQAQRDLIIKQTAFDTLSKRKQEEARNTQRDKILPLQALSHKNGDFAFLRDWFSQVSDEEWRMSIAPQLVRDNSTLVQIFSVPLKTSEYPGSSEIKETEARDEMDLETVKRKYSYSHSYQASLLNGKEISVSNHGSDVRLENVSNGQCLQIINTSLRSKSCEKRNVTQADLSPDGTKLLTRDTGGNTCLWNVSNGAHVCDLCTEDEKDRITSANFSLDGDYIITTRNGLDVWSSDGKWLLNINIHGPNFAVFSKNGDSILTHEDSYGYCSHKGKIDAKFLKEQTFKDFLKGRLTKEQTMLLLFLSTYPRHPKAVAVITFDDIAQKYLTYVTSRRLRDIFNSFHPIVQGALEKTYSLQRYNPLGALQASQQLRVPQPTTSNLPLRVSQQLRVPQPNSPLRSQLGASRASQQLRAPQPTTSNLPPRVSQQLRVSQPPTYEQLTRPLHSKTDNFSFLARWFPQAQQMQNVTDEEWKMSVSPQFVHNNSKLTQFFPVCLKAEKPIENREAYSSFGLRRARLRSADRVRPITLTDDSPFNDCYKKTTAYLNGRKIRIDVCGRTVKLLDTINGKCLQTICNGHHRDINHRDFNVTSAHFSPDGTKLLTLDKSSHVRSWELSNGRLVRDISIDDTFTSKYFITSANFSPNGNYIVVACQREKRLYSTNFGGQDNTDFCLQVLNNDGNFLLDIDVNKSGTLNSAGFSLDGDSIIINPGLEGAKKIDIKFLEEQTFKDFSAGRLTKEQTMLLLFLSSYSRRQVSSNYSHRQEKSGEVSFNDITQKYRHHSVNTRRLCSIFHSFHPVIKDAIKQAYSLRLSRY